MGRDITKQNNFLIKNMISAENEYGIYKKSKYNIIKKELESASVIINRWIENYKRKSNETFILDMEHLLLRQYYSDF